MTRVTVFWTALLSLVSMTAVADAPAPAVLLQLKHLNGQGTLLRGTFVSNDGSVVQFAGGTARIVKTLDAAEVGQIEKSIAAIQQVDLVRTNPTQTYNPGGFVNTYEMAVPRADFFTFAKNVSGVDFALPDSQGKDLASLLDDLDRL